MSNTFVEEEHASSTKALIRLTSQTSSSTKNKPLERKATMNINDAPLWGIHAGATGDAEKLFLQSNVVALGWNEIPDLGTLAPNRDAFKAAVDKAYPGRSKPAIANDAGQLFRLVHELKDGDLVLYPCKRTRTIHLGRIKGVYRYEDAASGYPHRRSVEWLNEKPRTAFSQGALYELGSAMSFFSVKNYADNVREVFNGKAVGVPALPVSSSPKADETTGITMESIEETTSDFILRRLAQETKGHPFAAFVGHLLERMGYRTRVSAPGSDGGIDIVAHRDELGFEPPIIKVQVKSSEGTTGDPVVSQLYGKVAPGEFGLFVTLGTFTTQAVRFADSKSNLRLIDGEALVRLILTHYETFDGAYKALLPLNRVYVPDIIEQSAH